MAGGGSEPVVSFLVVRLVLSMGGVVILSKNCEGTPLLWLRYFVTVAA